MESPAVTSHSPAASIYNGFGAVTMKSFSGQAFDVEDDFRHIFLHTGDGRKFMLDAVNFDRRNSNAREARREARAAGLLPRRGAEAALERLNDESCRMCRPA